MSRKALGCLLGACVLWLIAVPAFATDTVYYFMTDALHSTVVVTDQNRNIVEETHYGPYGLVLNRQLRDGPGYAGHEEDPATGLVYMQQRYYDPQAGRFISTDPVPVSGGAINRYAYASDNPYRYTDPTGEAATQPIPAPGSCNAGSACPRGGDQAVPQAADQQSVHQAEAGSIESRFAGQSAFMAGATGAGSSGEFVQPVHMTTGQRVVGGAMSAVFGSAFDAVKRPSNPTYVPLKFEHQLYMTGGVAVAAAASPDAVALGASVLPVTPEAVGAAGRVVVQHAPRAVMAACLGLAICSGGELPHEFAETEERLEQVYEGIETDAAGVYDQVVGGSQK